MAKFEYDNKLLSGLVDRLKELGELENTELVDEMLQAGADVIKDEWKNVIKENIKHPDRSTGDLIDSIDIIDKTSYHNAKKTKTKIKGINSVGVGPDGYDRKGVPNMIKAYCMHYGTSNQRGTRFVDIVHERADKSAVKAMAKVFNAYIDEKMKGD